MEIESRYLNAEDISKILGCSKSQAYKIIAILNQKMLEKGKMILRGRTSKKIFFAYYDI